MTPPPKPAKPRLRVNSHKPPRPMRRPPRPPTPPANGYDSTRTPEPVRR